MTINQLKDIATNLKHIVEPDGSAAAKFAVGGLIEKVQTLEDTYNTFNATGSERCAKLCNELRQQVEQIIVMVLRNVAENC